MNNIVKDRNIIPLYMIANNETAYIKELKGGQHFKEKCIRLGLIPGVKIEVISGQRNHAFLLYMNNSQIMVGYGMIKKIYVER